MSESPTQVLKGNTLTPDEERLHYLAGRLAENNLSVQIDSQVKMIEFLKGIEMKTASDYEKLEEAKRILKTLESEEYEVALRNIFAEHYSELAPEFIEKMVFEMAYETAVADIGIRLAPALYEVHDRFMWGVGDKQTIQ